MKRILSVTVVLCLLLSCVGVFAGCSSKNSKDWPVSYNGVTIDKEPEKIVVLNDVHADVISYLKYDVKMEGRSTECTQDFLSVVPTMGTAASPDVNAIAAAEADLVIADSTLSADAKSAIEANGAKVVTMGVPTNEDELKQLYIDLGTVLGGKETGQERGEKSYNDLFEMLNTLNTSAANSNIVQTAAYLYLDENGQLCTFVKGTLEYKFFNYNGNTNVFANQTVPEVNLQEMRLGSPNYIFYDSEEVLSMITADENLKNVNALRNDRTMLIPKVNFERYGKSVYETVFAMLKYIEQFNKATKDEAAPKATAPAASAPAASVTASAPAESTPAPDASAADAPAATTAAAATDEQQNEDVIVYTIEDSE